MNRLSIVIAGILAISPGASSGASYTPVSQMVISCKGKTPFESGICFGYIMATLNAATAEQSDGQSNNYFTTDDMTPDALVQHVVSYLKTIPLEEGASPAGPAILRALRKNPLTTSDS